MFLGGRFKPFKAVPSNDENNHENSVSFGNIATSDKLREEMLSLVDFSDISPEKITMPQTMVNQKQHLNSGGPFAQMLNAAASEKAKKRPFSKPCPKSKKKKIQSSSFNDEEKKLDNDLLGLVGSINTDKNLDSDCSNESIEFNDTIIVDDDNPFSPQTNLLSDVNSHKEKAAPTSPFFNNSLRPFISTDGAKHRTFAVEKKKGVEVKSCVPVFKEIMPSSFSRNNSSSTSSTLNSNSLLTESIIDNLSTTPKSAKSKALQDNSSKVGISDQSSISRTISDTCQSNKSLNYQSIYASMGLDEDLCDTEQGSNKFSNSVPKETIEITSSPEKLDNLSEVKVKTEVSSPNAYSDKRMNDDKSENLTLDGYHVSWTFEAETPCDDGEEEDIPLMLLKNKPVNLINPQLKSASKILSHEITLSPDKTNTTTGNNLDNFPSALFIKKELIEDEIVSESRAVSSNNLFLIPNAKYNTSTNSSSPVKIKSEPIDVEYSSENVNLNSLELLNSQPSAYSSTSLSEKTSNKMKKSNASKSSITTDTSKNSSILVKLLQDENLPSTSINSANTHISSNIIAENVNSTHSSLTELLDSSKPLSKRKKVLKKKVTNVIEGLENSFTQFAPSSELSVVPLTPDSGSLLTESTSNSNNLNTNNQNTIDRISETIEAVIKESVNLSDTIEAVIKESVNLSDTIETTIKESVKIKKQTKGKTKAVSKKSDLEKVSLSTINLKILVNDNKKIETQENYNTYSADNTYKEPTYETEIQLNLDKKENRKGESIEKDTNIDENVPITLLIKRQKTDTDVNSTGSFLCTDITNRSSTVEFSSVYNDVQGLDIDQCEDISFLSGKKDTGSNILSSESCNIPEHTKKKKSGKKKLSKKKAKQSPLLANTENEAIPTEISSAPIKESNSTLEETFCEKNKVKKAKNSYFYSKSASADGLTDLSSHDNLYTALSPSDEQSEESLSSSSFLTSISGDVNSLSEMNNLNSFSAPPKKKKRCRRNNGWYKKKKTRKDKQRSKIDQNVTSERVEIRNPVLGMPIDPLLLTVKTPIVVIKNLNSEIHNIQSNYVKVMHNTAEIQNVENSRAKISSEILEKLPVTSSSKVQKRKGNKSRKKPKPQTPIKSNFVQHEDEDTLEALPVSESNKISINSRIETVNLQNELSNMSEENSKNNSLEEIINESDISSSQKKKLTKEFELDNKVTTAKCKDSPVDSNVINNRRGGFFASLNVEAFEKQIEELEALIESKNNSDSLGQNRPSSNLKTVELQSKDDSIIMVKDTRKNLSITSKNSDGPLSSSTSFQTCNDIHVKQEINVDHGKNSANQIENTSQLNPFRATVFNQESTISATRRNFISSIASIKREKDLESQSLHKNIASKCIESCTSTSSRFTNQTGSLTPVENLNKTNSTSNSEYDASLSISESTNANSIGLAIKKEAIHNTKSVSKNIHSFRDQNDLIRLVHTSASKPSTINLHAANSERNFMRNLPDAQLDPIPESQKMPLELLNDNEIQIIPRENIRKDIPVIHLDDDDEFDDDLKNSGQRNQNKISEYDAITSISSKFIEFSKWIKTEKDDPKISSVIPEASNEIIESSNSSKQVSSFSFQKSAQIQDSVDPSKVRTVVSDSDFACNVSEDPIKRETSNPFIVRDKYIDYFKHPFPPSQACYKKKRNRSKIYERIDSTAWNLSVDEVESRLKRSEITMPQFGKKLGDVVKLEKYPVNKCEVECYHRILGVAPSHKLLSKCYLTPNQKFLTGFNNFLSRFEQSEMESKNTSSLSVSDLLQGITESKMLSNSFDCEKNSFDRDCPSAETKDSFDSSVSHSTDKCVSVIPDKDVEQSSSATVKQTELNSTSENISLISHNSSSSCITNLEDMSNNTVTNIDTSSNALSDYDSNSGIKPNEVSTPSYLQNNVLANLNLPSKEIVNNILNSTETSHSTTFKTSDTMPKCVTETTNTSSIVNNNESSLLPNYSRVELGVSSEINTSVSQTLTNTNKIFDIINLPVVELRKILDTAKVFPSTSSDNGTLLSDNTNSAILHDSSVNCDSLLPDTVNHDGRWRNIKTFEYNHTRSIPVANADSDQNTDISKVKDVFSESIEDAGEQPNNENSDDEYIDHEPVHCNSDNERSDSSSQENEEPPPIPQYKSKWEKIMERKSQEFIEKKKISKLYLKDSVPLSSLKPQGRRHSIYSKISEFADKKSEVPEENANSKVQNNKSDGKKQPEIKSKAETDSEKINVSQKTVKKAEKRNSKTRLDRLLNLNPIATKKESTKKEATKKETTKKEAFKTEATKKESPKKNRNKEPVEAPSLFEVPDKFVKTSPIKKPTASVKSNEKKEKSKFYGNRVTNRGTFLTEATPAKGLTHIKIPKKKSHEIAKKPANVRSEEFHSMIKSPEINIDLPRMSSSKNFNRGIDNRKNCDEYKSPLSNASPSITPHFIRTKRMRDRQNAYLNSHFAGKNISEKSVPQNKTALLPTPFSKSSPYLNDEIVQNRSPLLPSPPISSISPQEDLVGHKIPVLCSPSSNSPQPLLNTQSNFQENSMTHKIPVVCSLSSSSSQIPSDSFQTQPSKAFLQNILSIFNTNPNEASEVKDNMLPNLENIDSPWNNNQCNSPYRVAESSVAQNMTSQPNLSFDSVGSVSNPFRNLSQVVDSLNLQRPAVGLQQNINLPFNSVAPINTSLDPRRTSLGLQPNMLSNSAMSGSSTLTDTMDPRRAALGLQPSMPVGLGLQPSMPVGLGLQPSMPVGTPSADLLDPRRTALSQPNMTVGSLMSSNLINIPLSDNVDPRKAAFASSNKQLESPFNNASQILSSPPHISPMASASQQPPRKATCLVPSHFKKLVGHETIETHNVRLLMLEWSVDWLIQQQKLHDPPPISNALKKVSSSYDSFEDYYNTYFPLMLLETWQRIYVSWTHLNQTAPFLCQITSYSVKNHYVSVECQTVFSTDNRRKGVFPDEGSILMVKYSTKSNEYTIKILGYVTQVKTRRYNPVTDSKLCSSLSQNVNVNPDSLQILTLTFMGAYNSEDIDKRQPVRIHVLCTVKHNLKQNDAMLYINKSPLQRSILNPVADGLLTFSLTPRNSPEEKVNECVRDITKGILSPHPLPLLTVVRAKPESDRLNIIPLLIQKMKTAYKTKVLLCVRTVRALGDIAANICLQQSLKLVIINKRCDTNLQFQKYLLDELVSCEAKKMEEGAIGDKKLNSDACIKIKKQIIKDSDVILSLIRNSHDDFLDQTFQETESIAQMCCIVDEANLCTEPETLIPILHGISKLILIGDPDYTAKVLSKTASAYDFNQSFFQRAYDLDLLTE